MGIRAVRTKRVPWEKAEAIAFSIKNHVKAEPVEREKPLKAGYKKAFPKKLLFFDTETRPVEEIMLKNGKKAVRHELMLISYMLFERQGDFYRLKKAGWFTDKDAFTKFIIEQKRVTVFAHNLLYDYRAGINRQLLIDAGFSPTFESYEIGRVIIRWVYKSNSITFIDSMNYVKESLAEIGKMLGVEKLEMPSYEEDIEKWRIYSMRDVEILAKFILTLFDFMKKELGEFALTSPSMAYKIFLKRFMPKDVKLRPPADKEIRKLEVDSYYGGRVEVFRRGKFENIVVLDVNSMYPYSMRDLTVPIRPLAKIRNMSVEKLKELLEKDIPVIARVQLNIPSNVYIPPAPYKHPITKKLIFPSGKFVTTLASPELKIVLPFIERIELAVVYKGAKIFKDYVEYYYSKRQEAKEKGDKVNNMFYKLLLNSLYGKFGEKRKLQKMVADLKIDRSVLYISPKGKRYKIIDGVLIEVIPKDIDYGRFTAISSFITSQARAYLWKLMNMVPPEKILYCDTDSIHLINDFDYKKYLNLYLEPDNYESKNDHVKSGNITLEVTVKTSTLGLLKVEKTAKVGIYLAPKTYKLDGNVKVKGVPKRFAHDLLSQYHIEKVAGFRESVVIGLDNENVYWIEQEKILTLVSDKREYDNEGNSRPIVLNTLI
ncbi:MAG: hypothetical protein JHC26_09005 [Thermofilum sp.]|jgi:hypothetical protein|uniref:DNA polymerase n=1 Tax=Thermofilum sp. TaxID=1961369 RepID=UPI00258C6020|nr:DNA polymerase [Thermofilum sp.]MCI4409217.1 hypothetical protein [Thermofilum sp.]